MRFSHFASCSVGKRNGKEVEKLSRIVEHVYFDMRWFSERVLEMFVFCLKKIYILFEDGKGESADGCRKDERLKEVRRRMWTNFWDEKIKFRSCVDKKWSRYCRIVRIGGTCLELGGLFTFSIDTFHFHQFQTRTKLCWKCWVGYYSPLKWSVMPAIEWNIELPINGNKKE